MKSLYQQLNECFTAALEKIVPAELGVIDPLLRETSEKNFGDYQSNVAMSLAKVLKKSPRDVATALVQALDVAAICTRVEIAGPGFINLYLNPQFLADTLQNLRTDPHLGVAKAAKPKRHLVDFSSPNLAKEMHIGHLRATITGEVICRILEFQGHAVERVNHVGDWGTQFGMLLQYIYEAQPEVVKNPENFHVQDLEVFYKAAKARFDADESFADAARAKVVLLQSGDPTALKLWRAFLTESLHHCHAIYQTLGVTLTDVGESFYNDRLPLVVEELQSKGLAVESNGAVCIFLDGFTNREGEPLPFIIRKSDGGYNYATTDLAAMKYRITERHAERIIIITDIRQAQHFAMLFPAARLAGWANDETTLEHIGYGMVLGTDKRPFKTRSGDTVRLKDVISEAIERARQVIENNRGEGRGVAAQDVDSTAERVGLAAIKYFDLSHNLASDYIFSWDNMLAMDGNTGPYMLYAYARIQSIGRKAGLDLNALADDITIHLDHPAELGLAKVLIRFANVLETVGRDLKPHLLTEYLYDLSKMFSTFYDKKNGVPILDAPLPQLRQSRLALCQLTAQTLKQGLNLLSIETVDAM